MTPKQRFQNLFREPVPEWSCPDLEYVDPTQGAGFDAKINEPPAVAAFARPEIIGLRNPQRVRLFR